MEVLSEQAELPQLVCHVLADVGHGSVGSNDHLFTRLDGGLRAWTTAGLPLEEGEAGTPPGDVALHEIEAGIATIDDAAGWPLTGVLLDVRAPARYRGEQEPIDPVAGRIPGAANRFNMDNLSAQGTFKSAAELKKEFQSALGKRSPAEVIHYCGSGVAACHNILAMEVAGLIGSKLYPGSWSEWIADSTRPRENG